MRCFFLACILGLSCLLGKERLDCLKDVDKPLISSPIKSVDSIFVINLDKRPSKYASCLEEFAKYGIVPNRFSAVEGAAVSKEDINALGLVFMPHMKKGFIKKDPQIPLIKKTTSEDIGVPCFFYRFTAGAVGCYLSHVSLLKHLLESGSQALWILEDDFILLKDPSNLDKAVQDLNTLVGENGWDILFSDDEHFFDFEEDYDFYRPDFSTILEDFLLENFNKVNSFKNPPAFISAVEKLEKAHLVKWMNVNRKGFICSRYPDYFENFRRISGRFMMHSMIVKRSAAEKILDFFSKRGVFLPYDDELAFIPELRMYNLKKSITSHKEEISDTNM